MLSRKRRSTCKQEFQRRGLITLFLLPEQPLANQLALDGRDVIDEQLALKMIHFVLNADRQQVFGGQSKRVAFSIDGADLDLFRPKNRLIETGYRQTTFVRRYFSLAGDDLGVNEHQWRGVVGRDINHQHSQVNIDLACGQAYAGGCVHGLKHIVCEVGDFPGNIANLLGNGAQPRIGKLQYV
jgi:hypothetical protein